MKFFAIFAAVCAVASAGQTWTLFELSNAVSNPYTDGAVKPVLEQALDYIMDNIYTSDNYAPITITTTAGVAGHYTLAQLESLLKPDTNPVYLPHIEDAFEKLISAIFAGEDIQTVPVMMPALEISYLTLSELDAALSSPATNPALVPYLEHYLNQYMAALFAGHEVPGMAVAVPAGLGSIGTALPESSAPIVPSPVAVGPEVPSPVVPSPVVPSPVVPAPVVPGPTAPGASSPLVQIILNVRKSEDLDVVAPSPSPVLIPSPVGVAPQPIKPQPIQVVEQPIKPQPIQVVEQPIVSPSPIHVEEQPIPVNPIDSVLLPIEALPVGPIPSPVVIAPNPVQIVEQPIAMPAPIIIGQPTPVNPIDAVLLPVEARA